MPGKVQVYTGKGKGKTTAALGLALRAAGHGFKTCIIQFMKGKIDYGELKAAKRLSPYLNIFQFGRETFVDCKHPDSVDIELARKAMARAKEILRKKYDILILDEVNVAIKCKLIGLQEVMEIIKRKPNRMELILTGRYAPKEILKAADLVTEMREIKHYYKKGIKSREGIEW